MIRVILAFTAVFDALLAFMIVQMWCRKRPGTSLAPF